MEDQIQQLSFHPREFNEKFLLLDSMLQEQHQFMDEQRELYLELQDKLDRYTSPAEAQTIPENSGMPDLQKNPKNKNQAPKKN